MILGYLARVPDTSGFDRRDFPVLISLYHGKLQILNQK
jgi:hypothetical protein